jgi:CheY-like chemotaxis protein
MTLVLVFPELKGVLWVDDHPENNVAECAALAKLQIEVAAVRSTDEALARLANAAARDERFDLVISDWDRLAEGPLAGLRVLRAMRAGGTRSRSCFTMAPSTRGNVPSAPRVRGQPAPSARQ